MDSVRRSDLSEAGDPVERFIWQHREKFAAFSWRGLLKYGRGIVLVDARKWLAPGGSKTVVAEQPAEDFEKQVQIAYLPEGKIAKLSKTQQKKTALSMLRAYDPRAQMIVNVLKSDGSGIFVQVDLKDSAPPDAYRELVGSEDFQPQWKEGDTET